MHFQWKSQTRRVIVTRLCSSSAAVASHRLALCHELKQAQWTCCLHPTALLSRCGGPAMGGHLSSHWPLLLQVLKKLTVMPKLALMLRLQPLWCIYLQYVEPQHSWLLFCPVKTRFQKPFTFPGLMCLTFHLTDQNADVFFKRNAC